MCTNALYNFHIKIMFFKIFKVYGLAFSPDRSQLLSCSEDGTIRLWSLQTWTCLVAYKGHVFPVWQVCFASTGYYFASCGHDKTARLWTTDQSHCLRIFVGHVSDVDCIGKKHALKIHDQFTLNTSCFGGISGSNITLLCNFTKFLFKNKEYDVIVEAKIS